MKVIAALVFGCVLIFEPGPAIAEVCDKIVGGVMGTPWGEAWRPGDGTVEQPKQPANYWLRFWWSELKQYYFLPMTPVLVAYFVLLGAGLLWAKQKALTLPIVCPFLLYTMYPLVEANGNGVLRSIAEAGVSEGCLLPSVLRPDFLPAAIWIALWAAAASLVGGLFWFLAARRQAALHSQS